MCGIAGLVGEVPGDDVARAGARLLRVLAHRGPDDLGWLTWGAGAPTRGRGDPPAAPSRVVLLHRRLSIVDLTEGGWQPMVSADGRRHIVFNGEIYNHVELRAELEAEGHVFRSRSDTEVLLAALDAWGPAALRRLVGMFAFAVLDTVTGKVFLARDCFGIKPLYYARWQHGLAFASEIKALLELPGVGRAVHPGRLHDYLAHGQTDHGGDTMFADVHQLPAAHHLEVDADGRAGAPVRYWQPGGGAGARSFADAAREVRAVFLDNVRLHLRSDVPVGAALSGGVDSSAIVGAVRHLEPGLELHTFTYGAGDPAIDESRWADLAGRAAGAVSHTVTPSAAELVADLDQLIAVQDEPFSSTSIYAQFRVFRLARDAGIKVMLDGQGADELLAGYRPYLAAALASHLRAGRWASALRLLRSARELPGVDLPGLCARAGGLLAPTALQQPLRHLVGRGGFPSWLDATWFRARGVAPRSPRHVHAGGVLRAELRESVTMNSLPALLRYEDRNSMAHSIESRVPFLTPALADLVFSLPEDHLVADDATTKAVFREAMRGLVPDPILDRRDKIGFATPERRWLGTLEPWVDRVLASDAARRLPVLRVDVVAAEWRAVLAGRARFDFRVWRWLNLIRWADQRAVTF